MEIALTVCGGVLRISITVADPEASRSTASRSLVAGSTAALICHTGALLDYLVGSAPDHRVEAAHNLCAEAVSPDSAKAELSRIFQDPTDQSFADSKDPAKESATSH